MNERRKFQRVLEEVEVTITVQSSPEAPDMEGKVFPFKSVDISLGGLKLWVDIPVPIGASLELDIVFDHTPEKYRHTGNVAWVWVGEGLIEWHNIGIEFDELESPQFEAWESAVLVLLEMKQSDELI